MVAPKYERLNSGSADGVVGEEAAGGSGGGSEDDECEEVELYVDNNKKTVHNGIPTNFKFINTRGAAEGATSSESGNINMTTTRQNADARFMQMALCTLVIILLYLILSITLTFYQTDINRAFPFPLTIVSYHLVLKFFLAALVRHIYQLRAGKSRIQLDWRVAVRKMAPTGVASGIDIGFSNWGLALVPISLYTMTKSTTIVFILLFAIILGLEKKSWSLVGIVGLITAGLIMFTYKATHFNTLGFFFILIASLSSGVRWSFAQFIMQKSKLGLHNPIDMIYHMQPWMIASLLPLVIGIEGGRLHVVLKNLKNYSEEDIVWTMARITLGALIAFLMEVSEFLVLSKTSSLTLSIAGIFKDICQLVLAVTHKGDQLSLINIVGIVVCLGGIVCHLLHKYNNMAQADKQQQSLHLDNDNDDLTAEYNFNEAGGNASAGVHVGSHSTLTVPLLEQTDSDDESGNDVGNKQNSSDVIFDVLKRRDMQR